jgi:hypothetical protein
MRFRALLVPVPVALLAAPAAQAYPTFYGTAGPTSTIVLKRANGTVVKNTSRGNKTFVIRDRSTSHNFHLYGPGVDRRTRSRLWGHQDLVAAPLEDRQVHDRVRQASEHDDPKVQRLLAIG